MAKLKVKDWMVPGAGIGKMVGRLIEALTEEGTVKATLYAAPAVVMKATRVRFGGRVRGEDVLAQFSLTLGAPNFLERRFLRRAVRDGVRFPLRELQVKRAPCQLPRPRGKGDA